jgi:hypothetical protein
VVQRTNQAVYEMEEYCSADTVKEDQISSEYVRGGLGIYPFTVNWTRWTKYKRLQTDSKKG